MNIPRCHNLGICAHIDAGRTTLTERILKLTRQMYKREGEKGETNWESHEIYTPLPTVGQRYASKLISNLLKQ